MTIPSTSARMGTRIAAAGGAGVVLCAAEMERKTDVSNTERMTRKGRMNLPRVVEMFQTSRAALAYLRRSPV